MRQIVLDTETTGLDHSQGHRIIEIGCVEVDQRRLTGRHFHVYLNPHREVEEGALQVHGISNEFLADKPDFAQVAEEFLAFIRDSQLVIHNAPFDVGFLDSELERLAGFGRIQDYCEVLDTLVMAKKKHPGQRNSLDALCKRYSVDNSQRELHGALLDAEILADVYLLMSGGQAHLSLVEETDEKAASQELAAVGFARTDLSLRVIQASAQEQQAHRECLERIRKSSGGSCLWHNLEPQLADQ